MDSAISSIQQVASFSLTIFYHWFLTWRLMFYQFHWNLDRSINTALSFYVQKLCCLLLFGLHNWFFFILMMISINICRSLWSCHPWRQMPLLLSHCSHLNQQQFSLDPWYLECSSCLNHGQTKTAKGSNIIILSNNNNNRRQKRCSQGQNRDSQGQDRDNQGQNRDKTGTARDKTGTGA